MLLDVRGQVVPRGGLLLAGPHEVLDVVEVNALEVGTPIRHRLLVEDAQRPQPARRASTPARSSCPRCRARRPRTARAVRWRPRRRNRPSHSHTDPATRWSVPGSRPRAWSSCRRSLLGRGGFGAGCALKCWLLVLIERHVRGAGAVSVDDRGQPLHVSTQHLGERFPLGLAQFRELLGDVRHRAVMLAELYSVDRSAHRGCRWRRTRPWSVHRPRDRQWIQRHRIPRLLPTGWCRCGAARRSVRRRRRRFRGADAWPRPPGRRRCAPAWRAPRRSAGSAGRACRGRCAATMPPHWTAHHRPRAARRGACAHPRRRCRGARRSRLR